MNIGLIGLGKMGLNLALNLIDHNHQVFAYDKYLNQSLKDEYKKINLAESIDDLVKMLSKPRVIWVMVPAGEPTTIVIEQLYLKLEEDDIIIDGGNSRYSDTIKRSSQLSKKNIHLLDIGTSGGTTGARNGASLMIGGELEIYEMLKPVFKDLATKDGYAYLGPSGSGHYVKMVHNGIEYGMMQAIGEGFDLLESSDYEFDYEKVAQVWANGSIIEGLLMRMVRESFKKDSNLEHIAGRVDESGEGQWTIEEALKNKVSIPVITQALFSRYKSKDDVKFAEKLVAAMRKEFGGHRVYKKQ
jgi:6-phosphogluconate dehydrogenase